MSQKLCFHPRSCWQHRIRSSKTSSTHRSRCLPSRRRSDSSAAFHHVGVGGGCGCGEGHDVTGHVLDPFRRRQISQQSDGSSGTSQHVCLSDVSINRKQSEPGEFESVFCSLVWGLFMLHGTEPELPDMCER